MKKIFLILLLAIAFLVVPVLAEEIEFSKDSHLGWNGKLLKLAFASVEDCNDWYQTEICNLSFATSEYCGGIDCAGTFFGKDGVTIIVNGTYQYDADTNCLLLVSDLDNTCSHNYIQFAYNQFTPQMGDYQLIRSNNGCAYTHGESGCIDTTTYAAHGDYTTYLGEFPTPIADFSANDTSIIVDDYVLFTDLSTSSPICWLWYFDKPIPTFPPYCYQEADSTDQNATWQFTTYGYHNASLVVINNAGYDWETKENYIFANMDACGYSESAEISGDSIVYTNTPENYNLITNMLSSDNVSVIWGFTDGYNVYSPKNLYNYEKIEGSWFQYNETSMAYDIPVAEGDVTTQTITFYLTSEQYPDHEAYVRVHDIDCGKIDIDSMALTVSGSPYQHTLPIMVYDVTNGYLVNNFNLNVHDYTAGTWSNYTGINSNMLIPVDLYHNIALIVTKSGYDLCDHGYPDNECSRYYIYPDNPVSLNVYLNAACGAPAGQSCEHISVQWGYGSDWGVGTPIAGASVTVNGTTYSTNSAGLVNIYLENDTSFGVTISRESFQTVYENLTSGAEGVHNWNYYELVPLSLITPTVTIPTVPVTTMNGTGVDWSIGRNRETRQWEMIGQLYEFGPFLISLFILGIIVEVMKKMGKR